MQYICCPDCANISNMFSDFHLGFDCSHDFNGCSNNPCALGRNCTDLTPEQEKILGRSFNCSTCPVGYKVDSTEKCKG